jgi:hypothetical protein
MVICDDIYNAINNTSYGFSPNYFFKTVKKLNEDMKGNMLEADGNDMRLSLAKSLKISGNDILEYIGAVIYNDITTSQQPQNPPQSVIELKKHIFIDNHHDFSMDSRCSPKISRCLASPPSNTINAKLSFDAINKSKYNIHPLNSYNLNVPYYIEDTNSTTIKSKLNLSGNPDKMNLIANILDSAGCKYCEDKHNYNSIPVYL